MAAEPPSPRWTRCRGALWLALLFDALGALGLLVGACLDTGFSDLLIYVGGVGVFFSLPWWVFWSVGNLEVPPDELRDDVGLGARRADEASLESWRARRLARLARSFNARFSLSSSSVASFPAQVDRPHAHFAAAAAPALPGAAEAQPPERGGKTPSQAGAAGGPTAAPPPAASLSNGTTALQDLAGNRYS